MKNQKDKETSKGKKFILLGEDDLDDQEILEEVFESINADLYLQFINNGQKLINYIEAMQEEHLPCLLVLDYNMPELNGAEILKKLQQSEKMLHIPKIIWSTSNAQSYKTRCLELGACDYLVKPSNIHHLENMLKHMLSYCA